MINSLTSEIKLENVIVSGMKSVKRTNQNGRMYASTSGFCERQTALSMTFDGDTEYESASSGYFEVGLAIESVVLKALRQENTLLFSQLETPDIGLNLGGKIDGVYRLDNDKIRLLEIKSCGALPSKPSSEHLAQANLYTAITGLPATLLYFSRNIANFAGEIQMRKFELDTQSDIYNSMFKAIYGKVCADKGLMPDIPDEITKPGHCGFCRFKNICWDFEPSHLESMSNSEISENYHLTKELTDDMMSEVKLEQRRNGVLKHLMQYGTSYAKDLLTDTDWKDLI